MKTRQSLVSNSSSSSFIIRGIKVDYRDVCNLVGKVIPEPLTSEYEDKAGDLENFLEEKYKCSLTVTPVKNYFNFNDPYEDVIIGLNSQTSFEDGDIVKIEPVDDVDPKVLADLKKIGYDNPQLATWVQYVSNDNC